MVVHAINSSMLEADQEDCEFIVQSGYLKNKQKVSCLRPT
jgi:hypothetical protein